MAAANRSMRNWLILGAAAALLVAVALLWPRPNANDRKVANGTNEPPVVEDDPAVAVEAAPTIPRDDALRLIELRNLSLGHLENEELTACDPLLEEIIDRLPGDPFGPRNLTVARLLSLMQTNATADPAAHQAAADAALEAASILERVEGETAVLHVLRARIARSSTAGERQAFDEFVRAAEVAPDEAWIAYELFQSGRYATEPAMRERAAAALQRAGELQGDNVWLLIELLPLQADRKDPGIGDNLQRLAEIVAPFATTIAAHMRINPADLLQQAQQAADQQDWPTVLQKVRVVANVLRPDPLAQADKSRVDRHPLAFVLPGYSSATLARLDLPAAQPPDSIPVKFVTSADAPATGAVTDAQFADFNLDGRFDIFALGDARLAVVGRDEAGAWQSITEADVPAGLTHLLVADLDDDVDENANAPLNQSHETICRHADIDAITWGAGGVAVLQNRLDGESGARSIEIVEQNDAWAAIRDVRTVTPADLDHDGDLDLVVVADSGVSLWSSRGNLTFEDISDRSSLPPDPAGITGALAADWDRDLDVDVLLVGPGGIGILENLRHGRLRYRELPGAAGHAGRQTWGIADLDNNQSWDLVSAGDQGISVQFTDLAPDGSRQIQPQRRLIDSAVSDFDIFDYDNDGFLDVIAVGDGRVQVFRGGVDGPVSVQAELPADLSQRAQAVTAGDVDSDGDLDLLTAGPDGVRFVVNDGGNANRWIDVSARAQQIKGNQPSASGRINHLGIGSTLQLRAGQLDQLRIIRSGLTHFGLGQREQPDVVRILWTNGVPQNVIQPPANGEICELQTLKGSCPYLYTWNGERFEFCTDLLWAAPLGLQFAEGVVAPSRAWEYLKIRGDQLQADDGRYRLQITEELWEAAYVDQVRLIAVDHPADVEIFTNEKVGPAEIAEHKLHTVRERRLPVAARDQQGRDVLPIVAREDGKFLKAWDRKFRQGLTEPHSLELDLGDLDEPDRITLFLTGWVYPSDTSINVALSQNPDLDSPRPPLIETPDENGEWRVALPYMGFPGGKTKTIAVDVSKLFTNGDYRLRIGTTMEIHWDAVWFTADEPPGELEQTELELVAADLHFRGVSRREWLPDNGPEVYLYNDVNPHVPWPPMDGAFTRYGDVAPLLADWDDRMIVMAAGDELTLEFAGPAHAPPAGWVRDFVIYNVGWDKDADLNTVFGQSSEPLPYREMTDYGLRDSTVDPEFAEYLRTYQTRHQNRQRFWTELPGVSVE